MDVLNMNPHTVSVKLKTAAGKIDYATVVKGRRVTLPDGYTVDINWLAQQSRINTYEDTVSKSPIVLKQAAILAVPMPVPVVTETVNAKAD
jgi:hypothetical protein